ncbi:MAG: primosomal protein N' [Firmicutes bacterium]|nr:primosomal protein N' [Bacillota bacterium]
MAENEYAGVVVDLPKIQVDRTFTYKIPEELKGRVMQGSSVLVPFGSRKIAGFVVELSSNPPDSSGESEPFKIKEISKLLYPEPLLNKEFLELARWMCDYYGCFLIDAVNSIIPSPVRGSRKGKGKMEKDSKAYYQRPEKLTSGQSSALKAITEGLLRKKASAILIHGVTASGKTEVYLRAIQSALEAGRASIVLVPEIALTPQAIERFQGRFKNEIAVLHSALAPAERKAQWWRIKSGEAKVVLGTRSAVFAPMSNIGLIIIDEEHEPSYKQENTPRYNARQIAILRAKNHNSLVLLGSATPSLESFYWAKSGKYKLCTISERVERWSLPQVEIVDMRKSEKQGIFSNALIKEMESVLYRKEQIILFLNRRGFSSYLLCQECGHVIKCPHCDISMTYHMPEKSILCHYCYHKLPAPESCPSCGSYKIKYQSMGTQKVEEELKKLFPGESCLRMDKDTTLERGSHSKILGAFSRGDARILLGTQMIAKGLDFPAVTLVGVITADVALNMPDFRATERAFQLLMQVAGRSGRGNAPGKVIIQTFNPEHPGIKAAALHDYHNFYESEISAREELNFPPFSHLVNLIFWSEREESAPAMAEEFALKLKDKKAEGFQLLGPAPCPIPRLRKKFRWHIIIKTRKVQEIVRILRSNISELKLPEKSGITIDVDPYTLL